MKQRIAIIGGGIAGLTTAYLLIDKYDIKLYEKSERIGGNAYTLNTRYGEEVDIAVAAFGKSSYTNFFELLSRLNVKTVSPIGLNPLETFGVSVSFHNLDTLKGFYLTPSIKGLIAQRFEILKPAHIRSFLCLAKGIKTARKLIDAGELEDISLEEALKKVPHISDEAKLILVGGLALISSMYINDVLDAPAMFFLDKLKVHSDLLPPEALYSLRFAKNKTKSYIEALSSKYRDKVVTNSNIISVVRNNKHITLVMKDEGKQVFDKVVFACNADQALSLLEKPTNNEEQLLGVWRYTEGKITVHSDFSYFPERELMNGYTFLYKNAERFIETSISGSLWALPGVSRKCNLISTQHPNIPIKSDLIEFEKVFRTPIFDSKSCATIEQLSCLNGVRNTYYCGSHFGFGVHEDAVTSAIEVAKRLNVTF
jgi:predicted NAD/FAD-binding protein